MQELHHHIDMRLDSIYDAIMTRQPKRFDRQQKSFDRHSNCYDYAPGRDTTV